jgi:hypothetical protein
MKSTKPSLSLLSALILSARTRFSRDLLRLRAFRAGKLRKRRHNFAISFLTVLKVELTWTQVGELHHVGRYAEARCAIRGKIQSAATWNPRALPLDVCRVRLGNGLIAHERRINT